ncbi:MAG: amidase [Pseudomonadota bacterium]
MTGIEAKTPYPSLAELSDAYRAGTLRPSTVARAHLDRIERLDPKIGAFQAVYAEDAMALADAADKTISAGSWLGPLHGVPIGLKDICDIAGRVTTWGSKALEGRVAETTGTLTQRLISAGAIILGKTKTVEFALGGWGTNQRMGTPWNPWDMATHRVPGGSSSGTGAGVAAGLVPCGVGTDTGGSVRLPAAYCGLVGLKVTEGRLPTDGIMPLSHTLDTPGPMARSVEDALTFFLAMDGVAGSLIASSRRDRSGLYGALDAGVAGLRLGVLDDAERRTCTPDVLDAYDAALERLRALGAETEVFRPEADFARLTAACGELISAEGYAHHRRLVDRDDLPLDADVRDRMVAGRGISAADYLDMTARRTEHSARFLASLNGIDALVTPTARETAPPLSDITQAIAPSHFTRVANYFGLCALALPSGLSRGLPTSLQVVARPHDEAMALRIGAAFEAASPRLTYPDFA